MFRRFFAKHSRFQPQTTFSFEPRWKEELHVTGPGGTFVLELTMGVYAVHLPTQEVWERTAPDWARGHWPLLEKELKEWCVENGAEFFVDEDAFCHVAV